MRPTTQKKERLEMSENYRWYIQKMAELRVCREIQPLRIQLAELFQVVAECEARAALEDRLGYA
ncbi:MAG: hypothetical protein E6I89_11835 [Chloroflexi bacterium]|nr:MAG: hypothetical protein E6I89_11835 [Chloroflexota bacterium]